MSKILTETAVDYTLDIAYDFQYRYPESNRKTALIGDLKGSYGAVFLCKEFFILCREFSILSNNSLYSFHLPLYCLFFIWYSVLIHIGLPNNIHQTRNTSFEIFFRQAAVGQLFFQICPVA